MILSCGTVLCEKPLEKNRGIQGAIWHQRGRVLVIRNQSTLSRHAQRQQMKRSPFIRLWPLRSRVCRGAVRSVFALVAIAVCTVCMTTPGWCDEPKPAASRGGILAFPPLRALIGASDPPSYDANAVRHVPDDVAAQEALSSKSGAEPSSESSDVRKKEKASHSAQRKSSTKTPMHVRHSHQRWDHQRRGT